MAQSLPHAIEIDVRPVFCNADVMDESNTYSSIGDNTKALTAAASAGFASAFAQMIFLRELLALFSGYELAAGLFLASWLLWTALGSRLAADHSQKLSPGLLLLCIALLLPGTLLLLRGSRPLWGIPLGELPGLGLMLALCALVPALFCLCSGALFAVCWGRSAPARPLRVYLAEALGSGLAGLILFFLLLPLFSTLAAVLGVSFLLLAIVCLLLRPPRQWLCPVLTVLLALLFLIPAGNTYLEYRSRIWQWGQSYVDGRDTPYQNLAVCRQNDQFSLFSDGGWLFSIPDPLSTEYAVEPVLLLHPHPQSVLLLGGNPLELPAQVRKHPLINTVRLVMQDQGIPDLLRELMPDRKDAVATSADLLIADPGVTTRSPGPRYDIILLQMGEPVNAARNRFYTRDFFQATARKLAPGGLFSCSAPGAPEAVGPAQARLLSNLHATLRAVFPMVLALPGDQIRFVASQDTSYAAVNTATLLQRMQQRGNTSRFFRAPNVREMFNPFKQVYLQSLFAETPAPVLNRDFHPACYLDSLLSWARQLNEPLYSLLNTLSKTGTTTLWGVVAAAGLLLFLAPLGCKTQPLPLATGTAVAVTGACLMSYQLLLLLVFQILAGSLFSRLTLLVAASMAGLALGAWLTPRQRPVLRALLCTQAALCLLLAVFGPFFSLLHGLETPLPSQTLLAVCIAMALGGGVLGGLHFGLASRLLSESGQHQSRLGGKLYALDLAGASAGSLLVSLLLLPLYGLLPVMFAWTLLCAASLAGVFLAGKRQKADVRTLGTHCP